MYEGKRILAVVPARGGSKGIPMKNLASVGGKSLVRIVAEVISKVTAIDLAIISTDSVQIAEEAKLYGLRAPFLRPENLSGDRIADVDVLNHALLEAERTSGHHFDVILMLQPTSPFRTADHIIDTLKKLHEGDFDSVLTVSETDSKGHPLKQLVFRGENVVYYDNDGKKIIARQQLSPTYHRNGAAYALTRECLTKQKTVIGKNAGALLIEELLVNIDTPFDLKMAEFLFEPSKD